MDAVTEEEKLTASESLRYHILSAQKERDVYNACIKKCQETSEGANRKIQIFGVCVDSIPRQLNFVIDEDQTLGLDGKSTHGPDAVISMLDCAIQNYESDAESCAIRADNCPGQNKNRYVKLPISCGE